MSLIGLTGRVGRHVSHMYLDVDGLEEEHGCGGSPADTCVSGRPLGSGRLGVTETVTLFGIVFPSVESSVIVGR